MEATAGVSPEERADRLENAAEIVRVHDEAAREGQTAAPNLEDQVFVCFVSKNIWRNVWLIWIPSGRTFI